MIVVAHSQLAAVAVVAVASEIPVRGSDFPYKELSPSATFLLLLY